jgi:hypothetical protein
MLQLFSIARTELMVTQTKNVTTRIEAATETIAANSLRVEQVVEIQYKDVGARVGQIGHGVHQILAYLEKLPIPRGVWDEIFCVIDPLGGNLIVSLRYCHSYTVSCLQHGSATRFTQLEPTWNKGSGSYRQGESPTSGGRCICSARRLQHRNGRRKYYFTRRVREDGASWNNGRNDHR